MPRTKKFNRKRYHGNQFGGSKTGLGQVLTPETQPTKTSSTSKKLSGSKLPKDYEFEESDVNSVMILQLLSPAMNTVTECSGCSASNSLKITIDSGYTSGLAHRLVLECSECKFSAAFMNTKTIKYKHEVNLRYAYALRSIGKGLEAGKMFSAVMNLASPNSRMETLYKTILSSLTEVCDVSLRNAAFEAIEENENSHDIAAAFDGTWQKRGFKSLNGIVTVT